MSRALIALPKNSIQRREQDTISLLQMLQKKGFKEQPFEKPFRVFTYGFNTVKFNVRDAIAFHNGKEFRGVQYGDIIAHIEKELSN